MNPAIAFSGVSKSFGRVHAVEDVTLDVQPGEFVGLIGHNGAGKSTLLRMLTGLLRPDKGAIRLAGMNVWKQPMEARQVLGAVPENPALYEYLTAREHLNFVATVRGGDQIEELLATFHLTEDADRLIREYSQGMRRKVALATALLARPKVLVLDESLNGLDPPSAAKVKQILRERVDEGCAVLLSTHVVETVEAVADRVVMMAHGKLVADVLAQELPAGGLEELFLERMRATRYEDVE